MQQKIASPLRYPGGKSAFSVYIEAFMRENMLTGGLFLEPYAGGASASLALLSEGIIERAILAEADPLLYAFWRSVFSFTDDLCKQIKSTPVNLHTWHELQDYLRGNPIRKYGIKRSAVACLFLNRMNFSGILHAKPIGGIDQKGSKYKIDCRFNKERIIELICSIASFRSQVEVLYEDALSLIKKCVEIYLTLTALYILIHLITSKGTDYIGIITLMRTIEILLNILALKNMRG